MLNFQQKYASLFVFSLKICTITTKQCQEALICRHCECVCYINVVFCNRSWVLVARNLMQVKNGETRVLKRGWSMHLSGYDALFQLLS